MAVLLGMALVVFWIEPLAALSVIERRAPNVELNKPNSLATEGAIVFA
jgi:hypothetical protein